MNFLLNYSTCVLYAYFLFSHLFEFYCNGSYDALCSSISRSRIQFCLIRSEQQTRLLNSTKLFRTCHFSVLSPFQRFTPISALYPHFSALSPFQRFIPISAFYSNFSVLSPFQRFIPISAFYPHFSVLSPFQFPVSVSVSTVQFQRFIPTRTKMLGEERYS